MENEIEISKVLMKYLPEWKNDMVAEIVKVADKFVKDSKWYIWSIEHQGWWMPDENGYTSKKQYAGRYTFERACQIVKNANISNFEVPNESMIRAK